MSCACQATNAPNPLCNRRAPVIEEPLGTVVEGLTRPGSKGHPIRSFPKSSAQADHKHRGPEGPLERHRVREVHHPSTAKCQPTTGVLSIS